MNLIENISLEDAVGMYRRGYFFEINDGVVVRMVWKDGNL